MITNLISLTSVEEPISQRGFARPTKWCELKRAETTKRRCPIVAWLGQCAQSKHAEFDGVLANRVESPRRHH